MPNETITGKIYQVWNADKTERRFPQTVIEAVLGLPTYLQDQFSALADIYMPIEGITESKTGQEFVYRKSPATIKAKSLTLDRIYGKTLAWNQIYRFTSFPGYYASYCSYDTATNTFIITNAPRSYFEVSADPEQNIISGHKYYISANVIESTSGLTVFIKAGESEGIRLDTGSGVTSPGKYRKVHTATVSGAVGLTCWVTSGESIKFQLYLTDLTLLYGSEIDGMTDEQILAKFESEYPGYHDYEPGKLISNDAESLETTGFNQWDEEWENCYWDEGNGGVKKFSPLAFGCSDYVRVIPNTEYYFNSPAFLFFLLFYDADKNYISETHSTQVRSFTTPANCVYITFYTYSTGYGTTYNHDICINLSDPAKNGTYEPYRKTTLQLGLNNFKVKSHNIWNEEWEVGVLNKYGVVETLAYTTRRTTSFISVVPNTTYYQCCPSAAGFGRVVYYDENKNVVSQDIARGLAANSTFATPENAYYVRVTFGVSYGTTYNHDICINISSSFNGQYEPHGDIAITDGLKSAGSVRDEIVRNKYIKRIGEVVLTGTENWQKSDNVNVYSAPGVVPNALSGIHFITNYYNTVDGANTKASMPNKSTKAYGGSGIIDIKDDSYTSLSEFKNYLASLNSAGTPLVVYSELATPIEYELVEPLVYSMAAGTTEARVSPNTDSLSAPFCCDMTYDANANNDSANAQYAATAGRLYNTHKLWGRDFDGSNDVSGALSGVTTIDASGNITTVAQLISTVATGTAPLSVASTTEVANLHSYTATKLHTQRTLWGQNFDGSGNVTGDMSSVGNIAFYASGKNIASLLYFDTTNSRVGVGASSPAYKLDVNGTLNASGNTTIGGTLDVAGNTAILGTFTVGTSSVNKATTLYGALTASGAVSFTSTLGVTGLSTLAGGIKLTTTKKIWFGDSYYLELTSSGLHTNAGFYSDSFITAGGVGSGSGGGSNLVKERAYDISLTQIASSDYAELIRSPYITDSESGFMFAYSPAFLDTASQMHDYVIDAIGHEIGSCDIQWIGIAIGSTYTDVGVFDSGAFLVLAKSSNTYYWYEFEV